MRFLSFRGRGSIGVGTAALGLALTLAACSSGPAASSSSAKALSTVRVEVSNGAITDMLDFVAMDHGFFAKNHLPVQFVNLPSAPTAMTALAGHSVDVIAVSPEVPFAAVEKGLNLEVIGGQARVIWEFVVNNTISGGLQQAVQELKGKNLGVVSLNTPGQYLTEALLKSIGLSPNDVNFVAVGPPSAGIAALEKNEISGELVNEPTPTAIVLANAGRVLLDLRQGSTQYVPYLSGKDEVMDWAFTSWAQSHGPEVAAFRKSLAEADVWMHDPKNFNAVEQIYSKEIGTSVIPASDMTDFVKANLSTATAAASQDSLSAWLQFSVQYGVISAPIALSQVFAPGTPQTQADINQLAS